ncbi:MAG: cryptochrome/photolyase family protein [Glycocaulis sp.]
MTSSPSSSEKPVIVWLRQDLRLGDNPALMAAADDGAPLIAVYVLDDESPGKWKRGGASRWWLHKSLESLSADLARLGVTLIFRRGSADIVIGQLAGETGAQAVYWNRCYEPYARERDARLKDALKEAGVEAHSFNGSLLAEPWTLKTKDGGPFRVFSPLYRALEPTLDNVEPLPAPERLTGFEGDLASDALEGWKLLPTAPDWAAGFGDMWTPGEAGAHARLDAFVKDRAADYADTRNLPGLPGTSGLSPHLHFGEVSPRQVWARVAAEVPAGKGRETFCKELGWREFSYHLLYHYEDLPEANYQPKFNRFPWDFDAAAFRAWTRGQTGYPIVDAGMRELWSTGWMHNRVRMICASFLTKHLLIDWRKGEEWFWDTLVDADLANNSASWQWVAGSGADAAPYFRIFNPVTQGEKFDAAGDYVRRWVPELKYLPDAWLHAPWDAPAAALRQAGIVLGSTYPKPVIDHSKARERALAAFSSLKEAA